MPTSADPRSARLPARPGPTPSLTVEHIASAAVDIADARGLDAVTMRSVATGVGLSAAGLYRYVSSRDELVGHMVDQLSSRVVHPPPTGDWVEDLTGVAQQQMRLYRAHPWMVAAVGSLAHLGLHVLDHLDWALAVLGEIDAPTGRKLEAIALVNAVAALFAGAGHPPGPDAFAHVDQRRHPRLAEALATAPSTGSEDLFARVVEGLLHSVLGARSGSSGGGREHPR